MRLSRQKEGNRLMIPYTDDVCKKTDQLCVWKKGKYLNGILLFSVLMSICTGGFYRSPCPTDKPRKKSSVAGKRNVKLWLHVSLLACSLCLEMDRILKDQLHSCNLKNFSALQNCLWVDTHCYGLSPLVKSLNWIPSINGARITVLTNTISC